MLDQVIYDARNKMRCIYEDNYINYFIDWYRDRLGLPRSLMLTVCSVDHLTEHKNVKISEG
jgi:hypothetical protein